MKSQQQKDKDVIRKREIRTNARARLNNAERLRDEFNNLFMRSFPVLNRPQH